MAGSEPRREEICSALRESLAFGTEGDLPGEVRQDLERHLQECPECRRIHEERRQVWDLLGKSGPPAPISTDAEFLASVRRRIRRRAFWSRSLTAAAAAALLAGAGLIWTMFPGEEQAIIENMAGLQVIRGLQDENAGAGSDAVLEIASVLDDLLAEEAPGADEGWVDFIDLLIQEGEKG